MLSLEELEPRDLPSTFFPLAQVDANPHGAPGFSGQQLRGIYGFNATSATGAREVIAVVDAYHNPALQWDLFQYSRANGLPLPLCVQWNPTNAGYRPDWGMEEALDVEMVHALAPGAIIVVVEAPSAEDYSLMLADRIAASIPGVCAVSNSFGSLTEWPGETAYDGLLTTPLFHNPVAFVASTGDYGGIFTGYPASSAHVLAVGGTSLRANGSTYAGETAWQDGGGDVSYVIPKPFWQAPLPYSHRSTADVSFDADLSTGVEVYDLGMGGWIRVGGTSIGAPAWAAILADADQARAGVGMPTLDNTTLATILYSHPGAFHDVTSGSNGFANAGTGYDIPTGLGSPVVNRVVDVLMGRQV